MVRWPNHQRSFGGPTPGIIEVASRVAGDVPNSLIGADRENLSDKQAEIIKEIGSKLVPPATDVEISDVYQAMNDNSGSLIQSLEDNFGINQDEKALIDITAVIAGIAFAVIRSESEA